MRPPMPSTQEPWPAFEAIARVINAVVDETDDSRIAALCDSVAPAFGTDPHATAPISRAVDYALAVVWRLRAREQELTALYETAGTVAMQPDLDEMLDAIVQRARQLLKVDAAYLMLIGASGDDMYMRATEGTFSAGFRHIRLPIGTGLGGMVIADAKPYWTAKYGGDTRFHDRIDAIVAEEGIEAILGVPLRVGERVIGALFAAERVCRKFGSAQVSLLASLADHAAIAIDSRTTLQEREAAIEELAEAQREIRETSAALATSADIHEQLTRLVTTGGRVSDVLSVISDRMHRQAVLLDVTGTVRAYSGAGPAVDEDLVASLGNALDTASSTMRPVQFPHAPGERWVFPVAADGRQHGFLVITGQALQRIEVRTGERAALIIAFLEMLRSARTEAEERVRGAFLVDIVADEIDEASMRDRAELLGLDLKMGYRFVVADVGADKQQWTDIVSSAFSPVKPSMSAMWRGRLVVLLPEHEASTDSLDRLHRHLSRIARSPVTMGYSDVCCRPSELRQGFLDADTCVDALLAFGHAGAVADFAKIGAVGLMLRSSSPAAITEFVTSQLGALENRDVARHTQLIDTLEAYFQLAGSPSETSAVLGIHVNTFYQRLDRITDVLGEGWKSGERGMELQLALSLRRLLAPAQKIGGQSMQSIPQAAAPAGLRPRR
jgi:sugar diacid utilization regulator